MIYTEQKEIEDLTNLIEDTFDLCISNKDELYWLISLLRGFMYIPNKRKEYCNENFEINRWQYQLHPILEKYKKKWCHSNHG